MSEVIELGCAGHFILADRCAWHRHTQVGARFRVSTVGCLMKRTDLYDAGVVPLPAHPDKTETETVGSGRQYYYETLVFRTLPRPAEDNEGCGCLKIASLSELECTQYATAGEAQRGHEETVRKYIKELTP